MHGGYQKKMAGINLEVLKDPYPNYCTDDGTGVWSNK